MLAIAQITAVYEDNPISRPGYKFDSDFLNNSSTGIFTGLQIQTFKDEPNSDDQMEATRLSATRKAFCIKRQFTAANDAKRAQDFNFCYVDDMGTEVLLGTGILIGDYTNMPKSGNTTISNNTKFGMFISPSTIVDGSNIGYIAQMGSLFDTYPIEMYQDSRDIANTGTV